MSRIRLLFAISVLAALASALVACGGGGDGGGSSEDPNKVLDQTFSSDTPVVTSGDLGLKVNFKSSGARPSSFDLQLDGPFESEGEGKPSKLDVNVKVDSSGQSKNVNFDGGLISTGDAAFVSYKGSEYQAPPSLLDQFKSVTQAQGALQGQSKGAQQLLDLLGIKDPKSLLTNLKNEGDADVEGTSTIHISGDLDVDKAIDAVENALRTASAIGSLGGNSSSLPSPEQVNRLRNSIKQAHFDVYSGKDDHILRRLTVALSFELPSGPVHTVDVAFDYSLGKVNEPQTIEAPPNAKPFGQLLRQLGVSASQLSGVGNLGLGAGTPSVGGGGAATITPPAGGGSAQQDQKYIQCLGQAQSAADIQACEALLK